ncbi:hypothetical protein EVC29_083 [Rhizobium phage RHph_Y52]|nr:hypothetical protein EVB53_081 [Rhizobium phage RHph_Y60]QIG75312.1 hypothetical protein EVC16_083 [Rhizobium phage RHph_Y21]QIG76784.1 hypothetical protein EVC29_083 [Rhizobium phage RHph_Y52]
MTKQDVIDAIGKPSIMVTHRQELIDQNAAYPAAMIIAPAGRLVWPTMLDARVRPEHRNINSEYGKMGKRPDPWHDGVGHTPPTDLGRFDCAGRYRGPWTQQIGRILRSRDGYHQAMKGDRLFQVYRKGRKWVTIYYSRDTFHLKRSVSKRRALAIAKGEKWLCD